MLGVGEQDLAVAAHDVVGESLAASSVVDPDRHVPAERACGERDEHRGTVVEQDADVHRALGVGAAEDGGRGAPRVVEVFAPCPATVVVQDREGVVVVTVDQEFSHGLRHAPNLEPVLRRGVQIREIVY